MGVTVSLRLSHMVELGVRQLQGRSTKHRISDTHHFAGRLVLLSCQYLFFFLRVKVCTKTDGTVNIHPKSVNVEETEFHYNWLVYHLKMRTSSVRGGLCLCSLVL